MKKKKGLMTWLFMGVFGGQFRCLPPPFRSSFSKQQITATSQNEEKSVVAWRQLLLLTFQPNISVASKLRKGGRAGELLIPLTQSRILRSISLQVPLS
jgi:hypothetical protein